MGGGDRCPAYAEPLLLLAPAGLLYWCLDAKLATLAALAVACAVHALVLYYRYPHIVRPILYRVLGSWAIRTRWLKLNPQMLEQRDWVPVPVPCVGTNVMYVSQ